MPAPVSPYPLGLGYTHEFRGGLPVRGQDWSGVAQLVNHTLGKSYAPVPFCTPMVTLTSGTGYRMSFRTFQNYGCLDLYWPVWLSGASTSVGGSCTVKIPATGTAKTIAAQAYPGQATEPPIYRYRPSQAHGEVEYTVGFTSLSNNLILRGIGAYTIPRTRLRTDSTLTTPGDGGIETLDYRTGQPMYAEATGSYGRHRLALATGTRARIGQRTGQFMWSVPHRRESGTEITTFAKAITATSFGGAGSSSDIFGIGIPCHGRDAGPGVTYTDTMACRVLAKVSSGATGQVKLTGLGDTATITGITATTWTWYPSTAGAPATVAIAADSISEDDGISAGFGWDGTEVTFEAKTTAGTIYIAAVNCWEYPG
jgi:hypothetical protein